MKKKLAVLISLICIGTIEAQKDFKALFDGKSTAGWHSYGKNTAGSGWKAQDGILYFDPQAAVNGQGGDLVTDAEFQNFHLKLDWKTEKGSNSGIIFYINEDAQNYQNTYSTGLEMQILDNETHPDGKIKKHRAGDLYDLIQSRSEPVRETGKWNTAEIISKNGNLTFILNGVIVVETVLWDAAFQKRIADSKFAGWPEFGTFKKGRIALQDHGDKVYFRNILIKEL